MADVKFQAVEHEVAVAAPADAVFALITDVDQWPQFFTSFVYAQRGSDPEATDRVRCWGVAGTSSIRAWTARRFIDRPGLRMRFDNTPPPPGAAASTGEWIVRPAGDEACHVVLRHRIQPAGDALPAAVLDKFGEMSRSQLDELKSAAERRKQLEELTVSWEDTLFIAGDVTDAWAILYEADRWPERIPHVSAIDMTEDVPNIQFFDMHTSTPDGSTHTTRSVRVCLPHEMIAYKQLVRPPLLEAHTGHWRFTEIPEGVIAGARHTVTLKPSALDFLGPDTTVVAARRYARRVLSANSMKNLQIAKAYAEERADARG
jgi:C7-C12 aromatase (ARO/CYC)